MITLSFELNVLSPKRKLSYQSLMNFRFVQHFSDHKKKLCWRIFLWNMMYGQHAVQCSQAEPVVWGRQLKRVTEIVKVTGVAVAPSHLRWWMKTGDGGDERQSQCFLRWAAWFSAQRQTKREWWRSHPEKALSPFNVGNKRREGFSCHKIFLKNANHTSWLFTTFLKRIEQKTLTV